VFNVLLDTVIGRLTVRSSAAKKIYDKFYFCVELPDDGFRASGRESQVIGWTIVMTLVRILWKKRNTCRLFIALTLEASSWGHCITEHTGWIQTWESFPNVCVSLRILLTMPATVASAERSFSKLKLIKNLSRTTMKQDRLVDLARLSIESEIANWHCDQKFCQEKSEQGCFVCG